MILLFDVDGTLVESGQVITDEILELLRQLKEKGIELGLVGGGTYETICRQIKDKDIFDYIFAECGSLVYFGQTLMHQNNIRHHPQYHLLDPVIKLTLNYLSNVPYQLTGHLIDRRNGLIYISLIGMQASLDERKTFIELDKQFSYRQQLFKLIEDKLRQTDFEVVYGGSVGLSVYPKEWNKRQVINHLPETTVHYFGDKYTPDGNDYPLLNHPRITPHCVNNPQETSDIIKTFLSSV